MLAPSTSNETLRNQFQQLQEQQKNRLLQQRQKQLETKKKTQEKKDQKDSDLSDVSLGVEDNLELKLSSNNNLKMAASEMFQDPDEQVRELKDENGRLYKLLREKDQEIRQMKKKLEESKELGAAGASAITNDNAAVKIVELSKKVRELNAEVESERAKTKQIARKCQELEKEVTHDNTIDKFSESENKDLNQDELKATQEKLKQTELRVMDLRNQVQSLKAELKVSQKILAQEVGEGVSIQSLIAGSSGWKGRTQQIAALQKKVSELRKQLEEKVEQSSQSDINSISSQAEYREDPVSGFTSQNSARNNNPTERHKEQIRKMEKQRMESQERLREELKALEQRNTELKQKFEASKARNNSLSEEMKILKKQNQLLSEKGSHDNELIEMLMKQQAHWKKLAEDNSKKIQEETEDLQKTQRQLVAGQQLDRITNDQLKFIITEKEQRIRSLEDEIRQLKQSKSTSNTGYKSFSTLVNTTEVVQSEPDFAAQILSEVLSPTPSRAASRSNNYGHSQQNSSYHELNSLYQASSVVKDRLSELVQVLEKRIEESTLKVVEAQNELQAEKRRNAVLEKQLGKMKLDRNPTDGKQRGKKSTAPGGVRNSVSFEDFTEAPGNSLLLCFIGWKFKETRMKH